MPQRSCTEKGSRTAINTASRHQTTIGQKKEPNCRSQSETRSTNCSSCEMGNAHHKECKDERVHPVHHLPTLKYNSSPVLVGAKLHHHEGCKLASPSARFARCKLASPARSSRMLQQRLVVVHHQRTVRRLDKPGARQLFPGCINDKSRKRWSTTIALNNRTSCDP